VWLLCGVPSWCCQHTLFFLHVRRFFVLDDLSKTSALLAGGGRFIFAVNFHCLELAPQHSAQCHSAPPYRILNLYLVSPCLLLCWMSWWPITHRYLRKVDFSTNVSFRCIHFNKTRALSSRFKTKANIRQPWLPSWPACFVLCPLLVLAFQCFLQ